MKRMAYIPGAVRQVLIPKADNSQAMRSLGISNFEDKLVQRAMHKVLESIYEPIFSENSYGFRPGKSCHDAISALHAHLSTHEVETVIDVDLSNYFGSIPQDLAIDVIKKKISDPRLLRYLIRMFKSGMLIEGDLKVSDEGVVQGSACSPIIANIFAHEVIDEWMGTTVKDHCLGEIKMIRYADDIVICCQYHQDAQRVKIALARRLAKYGLKMNEAKTRLVKFSKREQRKGNRQETFDFLGFTFYYGKSRKGYACALKTSKSEDIRSQKESQWSFHQNKISLNQIMKIAAKLGDMSVLWRIQLSSGDQFISRVTRILFNGSIDMSIQLGAVQ